MLLLSYEKPAAMHITVCTVYCFTQIWLGNEFISLLNPKYKKKNISSTQLNSNVYLTPTSKIMNNHVYTNRMMLKRMAKEEMESQLLNIATSY